jgi:hypothetical protein
MPEWSVIDQSLPTRSPAAGLGHIGFNRCFVDESQPFQMIGHEGLPMRDPDMTKVRYILALLLESLKVFFLCDSPSL